MAFVASVSATEPRKFSVGPLQIEMQPVSMLSTDTTGTITAQRLSRIDDVLFHMTGGPALTAAPTISGLTATLVFADPAAACTGYVAKTCTGYVFLLGR
jgi:hypothetical protein